MSLTPGATPNPTSATGPPQVLGTTPTPLGLLKALRRCWLRATVLGVIVAAAAGAAAWFLIPPSKHLARTLMRHFRGCQAA